MQAFLRSQFAREFERFLKFAINSAPRERIAVFFSGLLPCGTTITARRPFNLAANAMDWP